VRRLAALLAALVVPAAAWAADATVFAAASLKDAFDAAIAGFRESGGGAVLASYAASNALARQIENGAPADIFISADPEWADYLERRGLARPGSRVNLLTNELVLIAPASSEARIKLREGVDLAGFLGTRRIALADPDVVPAGMYAKAAFTRLGIWGSLQGRVAAADNVRAALALVARGETPLGVVYRTDAMREKAVRIVDTFPRASHPPVIYPLVRLRRESAAADRFAEWLRGAGARAIFERFGFGVA
jgi:molybdate transport system substrate-binding protein